ncbi:TetR/AcrR family transcriptional regulator [Agromyces seonyuensis]|uniref:TetR family transcriptional regulator n=1 Tax=Agromyces seonyuensis TaxID=2662446 RepID=A0A6I4NWX0_9MICO|nr:TetR/AcrR family transcriptional regulator [Agromyces seonyuensis]MWB98783.1 TetR family transcriptional regulator [Agromyces seonyuensis]
MPKVSAAYKAARRDEIIDAALRCVQRDGYRGTSMAAVIAESGLSAGAIYGHFAGKQEILVAVAERVLAGRQADLEAARVDGQPLSPAALVSALVGGMRLEKATRVIPQVWAEAAVDPEIAEIAGRIFLRVHRLLRTELAAWAAAEPGRVDGDPGAWADLVVPAVIAAVPGFLVQRAILPQFDEDAFIAALPLVYRG